MDRRPLIASSSAALAATVCSNNILAATNLNVALEGGPVHFSIAVSSIPTPILSASALALRLARLAAIFTPLRFAHTAPLKKLLFASGE
jgi:hypothetical protein